MHCYECYGLKDKIIMLITATLLQAFEINGQIDAEAFRHSLMTFGNKFSASEVIKQIFNVF